MFTKKYQKKLMIMSKQKKKKENNSNILSAHTGGGCQNRHPLLKSRRSPKILWRDILEKAFYGIYKELTGLDMQGVFRILLSSLLAENVGFVSSL